MIELRDAGTVWKLGGLATTWSRSPEHSTYFVSDIENGMFIERVARNAFVGATRGANEVSLLREHDQEGHKYATTTNRTMALADTNEGLYLAAAMAKGNRDADEAARDIRSSILKGLSVGMRVVKDNWTKAADGRTELRTITKATLYEVSMVRRPANHSTSLDLRSDRTGGLEYRSVPLVYESRDLPTLTSPDNGNTDDMDNDDQDCPTCGGTGVVGQGQDLRTCHNCAGTGVASDNDEDDRAAADAHDGDRQSTHAHLMDTLLTHSRHAGVHVARLADSDVKGSAASTRFNLTHALNHLTQAHEHALKLDAHMRTHPSDPTRYDRERDRLSTGRSERLAPNDSEALFEALVVADGRAARVDDAARRDEEARPPEASLIRQLFADYERLRAR